MRDQAPFSLALVTGASSGIGRALSQLLAKLQIPLILTGRDLVQLQTLQEELSSIVDVTIVKADLLLTEDRKKIIQLIHDRKPDLLINNAGYGLYGDALSYDTQDQVDILTVNAHAVLELTLEAARTLIALSRKGVILNVASAAAYETIPGLSVYAAAKSCVVKFSESLDYETADRGVRILASCPGMVDTNFRLRASSKTDEEPLKHAMTPQYAAEQIWLQIVRGQRVHVFNWKYRLALFVSKYLLPKTWVAAYLKKNIQKRTKNVINSDH